MNSPYYDVPSCLSQTGNPDLNTSWRRYRHGCDPPNSQRRERASPPYRSGPNSRPSIHPRNHCYPLASLSPFQNIPWTHPRQSSICFEKFFPISCEGHIHSSVVPIDTERLSRSAVGHHYRTLKARHHTLTVTQESAPEIDQAKKPMKGRHHAIHG